MTPGTSGAAGGTPRQVTLGGRLARFGFADPGRAETLLADRAFAGLIPTVDDVLAGNGPRGAQGLLAAVADAADPDLALLGLLRLLESLTAAAGSESSMNALRGELLGEDTPVRRRLLAVLGTSAALADHLARHPRHWEVLAEPDPELPPEIVDEARADRLRAELLVAVGADPADAEPVARPTPREPTPSGAAPGWTRGDALRVAYYRRLLALAGRDLSHPEPVSIVPDVAAELADLAAAALEAALALARADLAPGAAPCRLAVIGMGKCGGRELNYVSDVDVIYVAEPGVLEDGSPADEQAALRTGAQLASRLAQICGAVTAQGTLWPVDAGLRPEGKQGPLVRTVASHLAYYGRWAQTWEFQALLKARIVAGDRELGRRYLAGVTELVWVASERENFVPDVQAMRRRVEQHAGVNGSGAGADRQLKLGPGGLRDVEFSVQLLQLVHGRADPRVRTANTWIGLEALSTYGYVGRGDANEMDQAYRFLRALEHRIQLYKLHRSHVVPSGIGDLRRLGRSFGYRANPADELTKAWRARAREVRRLHEKLFYRPLLAAAAALTTDEARLTPEAARTRLSALGYRDPAGAMRHIAALTTGVSRRAQMQRQLLPVMLGWFADGADPDAGLLAFRTLSEALGATHWYLKMLRDSGAAAERLAHVLSASQLVTDLLEKGPEAVALLEADDGLTPIGLDAMITSVRRGAARWAGDPFSAGMAARSVRRRELVRTAIADVVGLADVEAVGAALSDAWVAAIDGALVAACDVVREKTRAELPTLISVVALGRLGGHEVNYGSDADLIFVNQPLPGAGEQEARDAALQIVAELRRLLSTTGPEPPLPVDVDLRPEGRQGVLVRTLDSYRQYYARWSSPWEAQALTRARPVAGDAALGREYVALIDPLRWPLGGLDDGVVREIRRIKARVEAERLPRGADPHRHLKLGRGGLSDVEWTVQLLQLQHAHAVPELQVTGTLAALRAATSAGLVAADDARVLETAWTFASRLRNAIMLWRGRPSDLPPTDVRGLDGVARLAGYPPHSAARMDDDYQRATRRCRAVVERVFYS
ncbi:bifunctional [glutamine synthetase] adenylyltransferase/[glutamine synthetase]-adenylyl-L-tyrosine phosphorylase [Spongisporangium articulatum]|uniref:Bifunctional [glutamine synthetase] adenylyltransferase/[glutamine synthetase]-adenylyl-L-tyrosine phosphorylase n=1 Tax=Spongisporangium articulatum TaxID=3362603 RepID=A0ABW8ALW3_9ACTN